MSETSDKATLWRQHIEGWQSSGLTQQAYCQAREIAFVKGFTKNSVGNTWGPSLNYLKSNNFLSEKEEKALAAVFTFISDGAHTVPKNIFKPTHS